MLNWIETRTDEELAAAARALLARGHDIRVNLDPNAFGRGQIIWRDPKTGVLTGGSESRTDWVGIARDSRKLAAALVQQGVLGVTVLGQNVNAYGMSFADPDMPRNRGAFAELLQSL